MSCLSPVSFNKWYIPTILNGETFIARLNGLVDDDLLLLAIELLLVAIVISAVLIISTRRCMSLSLKEENRLRNEPLADTDSFMTVDLHENTILRSTASLIGE